MSLLSELSDDTRRAVVAASIPGFVRAGEWVFRQGEVADAMYIINSGRLEVIEEVRASPGLVLRSLGPGSSIGEIAVLTGSRRSASVRARRDSVLLRLDSAGFEALLRSRPELTLALTRALGRWLAQARRPRSLKTQPAVLALTPVGPGLGLTMLGERLARAVKALASHPRAVVVNGGRAWAEAAGNGLRKGGSNGEVAQALAGLLDRWERDHDIVILSTDAPDPDDPDARTWSEFCHRSADRTVVAISPTDTVTRSLASCERLRSQLADPPDLCFLGTHEPNLIGGWLDVLPSRTHHHVSARSEQDTDDTVARMVRRLTGRSVGVVLSGGGAPGFAHLGVLNTLETAGIPVDRVGGCSIGAITGALYAAGYTHESSVETCRRFFLRSNPLNDYVVPRTALLRGGKLRANLQAALGEIPIEALPRSYYCVSADLVAAETVIHRRGALWRALLASASIPGLLPPVPVEERLLVDGGVLDNLPVDVMAYAQEGPVVAVDVTRPFSEQSRGVVDGETGRRLPLIAEVLARVSVLGSRRSAEWNRPLAAFTITLPDDGTRTLDWHRLDAIVAAGRRAGKAALAGGLFEALRAGEVQPPSEE